MNHVQKKSPKYYLFLKGNEGGVLFDFFPLIIIHNS